MGSKQIMIQEWVYNELSKFRDDKGLKSFTEAIKELLNLREVYRVTLLEERIDIPSLEVSAGYDTTAKITKVSPSASTDFGS